MINKILKIKGVSELKKEAQRTVLGGANCPTYPASRCISCGGHPLPNGCCLGTSFTHTCLTGISDVR